MTNYDMRRPGLFVDSDYDDDKENSAPLPIPHGTKRRHESPALERVVFQSTSNMCSSPDGGRRVLGDIMLEKGSSKHLANDDDNDDDSADRAGGSSSQLLIPDLGLRKPEVKHSNLQNAANIISVPMRSTNKNSLIVDREFDHAMSALRPPQLRIDNEKSTTVRNVLPVRGGPRKRSIQLRPKMAAIELQQQHVEQEEKVMPSFPFADSGMFSRDEETEGVNNYASLPLKSSASFLFADEGCNDESMGSPSGSAGSPEKKNGSLLPYTSASAANTSYMNTPRDSVSSNLFSCPATATPRLGGVCVGEYQSPHWAKSVSINPFSPVPPEYLGAVDGSAATTPTRVHHEGNTNKRYRTDMKGRKIKAPLSAPINVGGEIFHGRHSRKSSDPCYPVDTSSPGRSSLEMSQPPPTSVKPRLDTYRGRSNTSMTDCGEDVSPMDVTTFPPSVPSPPNEMKMPPETPSKKPSSRGKESFFRPRTRTGSIDELYSSDYQSGEEEDNENASGKDSYSSDNTQHVPCKNEQLNHDIPPFPLSIDTNIDSDNTPHFYNQHQTALTTTAASAIRPTFSFSPPRIRYNSTSHRCSSLERPRKKPSSHSPGSATGHRRRPRRHSMVAQWKQKQSRFHDDFQEIGQLGNGSFGMVLKCISRLDGCMYAVKVMKREARGDLDRRNVLKEVHALAALCNQSDPATFHIVRYHQAWMEENRLHIQTELCESTLQQEMVNNDGGVSLDERRIFKVLREISLALEFIHRNEMVHLDIKPENIFIKNNQFKLGDFGLASKATSGSDVEEGDSRYMSKELLSGNCNDLTKCDIFSLGATVYEACLGEGRTLPADGSKWQDIRSGGQFLFPDKEGKDKRYKKNGKNLRAIIVDMMHPDPVVRPRASNLLKRRELLSEEEKRLIEEQNKVKEASMALAAINKEQLKGGTIGAGGVSMMPTKKKLTRANSYAL